MSGGRNRETWGRSRRIAVAEAVRVSPYDRACDTHGERIERSIAPGRRADPMTLAGNVYTIDPERTCDIPIARTLVGGTTMYPS